MKAVISLQNVLAWAESGPLESSRNGHAGYEHILYPGAVGHDAAAKLAAMVTVATAILPVAK